MDHYYDLYVLHQNSPDTNRRCRSIARMHQSLIQAQELGDEKMQIVNLLQEIIDGKVRQLDTDQQNLDLKEERERYAQLDDGPPSKIQRLQSPMCDQGNSAGNNVLNSSGLGNSTNSVAKDHYGGLPFGAVMGVTASGGGISGNGGGSTPTYDRSSHLNSSGNGFNGTFCGSNSELQRSGSKRSRRRNESLPNNGSSTEMGGNESNSANEAGSSGNGTSDRKASMGSSGGLGQRKSQVQLSSGGVASGTGGGTGNGGGSNSGKKKKRKVRGAGASNTATNAREETPPPEPIDPDEPTYCVCNQVCNAKVHDNHITTVINVLSIQISFGEMILCDNDLCPIEWFHFSCVSLVLKPKGKWFCPNCRGERPNVMKPKAQFLKELERYNKEKEEKT